MSIKTNEFTLGRIASRVALKVVFILVVISLPGVIHGYPHSDRLPNENSIAENGEFNLPSFNEKTAGVIDGDLIPIKVRQKRLSDQRRAELETLMALSKMTGKLATISRGGRQLDPQKIGRRRRSITDKNIKNLQNLLRLLGNFNPKENAAYPLIS